MTENHPHRPCARCRDTQPNISHWVSEQRYDDDTFETLCNLCRRDAEDPVDDANVAGERGARTVSSPHMK